MKSDSIILVDGSALLFRAFYGIKPLSNSKGQGTHVVLGFIKSLKKIIKTFKKGQIVVAWDSKKSVRRDAYPSYKENRQSTPVDLLEQKKIVEEVLSRCKVPQVLVEGFEADDIIFSCSEKYKETHEVVIATADKDLMQLVDKHVKMYDPFKEILYDEARVVEKLNFGPEKVAFYYSLVGDSSDNIPGVTGIGAKSAEKIVIQFSSLHDLYENLASVESRPLREKLENGRADAFLSMNLFQLRLVDIEDLFFTSMENIDWHSAVDIFRELELKSLISSDVPAAPAFNQGVDCEFELVSSIEKFLNILSGASVVAIDLETSGLDWVSSEIVGISFAVEPKKSFYMPLRHVDSFGVLLQSQVEWLALKPHIQALMKNEAVVKVLHNTKFDLHFFKKAGVAEFYNIFDTAICARLLLPEWFKVGLKSLSISEFGVQREELRDIFKRLKIDSFAKIGLDEALSYAALDAHQTLALHRKFGPMLDDNVEAKDLFYKIEMPISLILLEMENAGILVDKELILRSGEELSLRLEVLEKELFSLIQSEAPGFDLASFNLNSPKQLKELLFGVLKLSSSKKSESGELSTDVEVLHDLTKQSPIPSLIIEHRKVSKLKNTYFDALPGYVSASDGAIHTDYSQIIVATGRLSSNNPNLQNVPSEVRPCFVAREGFIFVAADYSQIELRVLAELCRDPKLIDAFNQGLDIHLNTAELIFHKKASLISEKERSFAKKINFSILYGLSAFSLSKDLDVSAVEAQNAIKNFFLAYPLVRAWMDSELQKAEANGFVKTILGRKRWFRNLSEKNKIVVKAEQRAAINAIVQGSAADLMKLAMIAVEGLLKQISPSSRILLQVHDEIVLEVPASENLPELFSNLASAMEKVVSWVVPAKVNFKSGFSWGTLEKAQK